MGFVSLCAGHVDPAGAELVPRGSPVHLEQRMFLCEVLHRDVIHDTQSKKEAFIKPQLVQLSDGGQAQSKPVRNPLEFGQSGLCPPVHSSYRTLLSLDLAEKPCGNN